MTSESVVRYEKKDGAFWITLNRPEQRNAINNEVIAGIKHGYELAHDDTDVRVIVLTGAGEKAFCAGGDLKPGGGFVFDFSQPNGAYADLLRLARKSILPSIARINGTCLAGGMGLLAMTDMAVAADHVQFGLPEVKVGLFPMQVLSLLMGMIPPRILNEWCLTGEPFDAATAKDAGLVNHVVPCADLDDKTNWLVSRLADKSPTAIRLGKYAMRTAASMSFEQKIAYLEGQIILTAMTEDAKEGMAAFAEKRKSKWTGR